MFLKELQEIGFSKNEAKVYETVLELGECSVSDIAKKSGIHRRSVYDTIERLQEKGIIFAVFSGKENNFTAASPEKVLELLNEKKNIFEKILPYLKERENKKSVLEKAMTYKGEEGYKNFLKDMTRVGEDCYFLGVKGNWYNSEKYSDLQEDFRKTLKRNGKTIKTIFDPRVKDNKDIDIKTYGEYKFLPDGFETPGVLDIFGDYIVTFNPSGIGNMSDKGTIYVILNKDLAESYKKWFKFIWENC